MSQAEILHTGFYALGFIVLFAIGEFLYHVMKVQAELTRKFVHLITGVICLSFPFVLSTHWSVLILTLAFVAILVISLKFNLLKSINAVNRKTRGSFLFPIVIYLTFWIYSIYGEHNMRGSNLYYYDKDGTFSLGGTIYYFLPILLLSVSDPMAALFGKRWPYGKYKILNETKTLIGSSAFFLSAFILSILFIIPNSGSISDAILISLSVALATTLIEAVSQKGFDNLLIPLSAAGILILFKDLLTLW